MKDDTTKKISDDLTKLGRRQFFRKAGKATIGAVAAGAVLPAVESKPVNAQAKNVESYYSHRAKASYHFRLERAKDNYPLLGRNFQRYSNGDESLYPNRIASYTKGLPHHDNGEVHADAFDIFLDALKSGDPALFEQIPTPGPRLQTNPQAGFAFDLEGSDPFTFVQRPAPKFASRELAAEIAENYWMALLRDVPFSQYEIDPVAKAAADDLTSFGDDFTGPKQNGGVTHTTLFRGLTPGDLQGPYISQFFYRRCNFGANEIGQKMRTVLSPAAGGLDYMTDFQSWLEIQNGADPTGTDIYDPVNRYIRNGRDLGQWVHIDVLFQAYFHAFLILDGMGCPVDDGNPYKTSKTQIGFGTFGGPHIATILCEVSTRALKAVWNQKWLVHRRFRPEAFAARVDRTLHHAAGYPIHPEILDSLSTGSRLGGFMPADNSLLPMAFPEGSPTHPAYGAGHATVAGACVTILKAWFDDSFVLPDPVEPDIHGQVLVPYADGDTLSVRDELNKIASNVAVGRNIAGVHWRTDATESLKLGEQVAIALLRDQKSSYLENFSGFSLSKFDGTTITV